MACLPLSSWVVPQLASRSLRSARTPAFQWGRRHLVFNVLPAVGANAKSSSHWPSMPTMSGAAREKGPGVSRGQQGSAGV